MRRLALFLLGTITALGAVVSIKMPEEARFAALHGDAQRLNEVRNRIESDARDIDVAFFGSSHTMTGIADSLIEAELRSRGLNVTVANLGTVYMGRDLQLYWVRMLLAKRKPKLIVVEASEHEYEFGHVLLPYVAEPRDMFCCSFYIDPKFPGNFSVFMKRQFGHAVQRVSGNLPTAPGSAQWTHGWKPVDKQMAITDYEAALADPGRASKFKERIHALVPFYGLGIVDQIEAEARSKNVKLAFVYLPSLRYTRREPAVSPGAYSARAPLIEFPASLVDLAYWYDDAHLSKTGAEALAPKVAAGVSAILSRNSLAAPKP